MSKPIRVALSGSGFRFPAHVGALLAIRDAGYAPIEYAGTSGGSLIAALAACGMSIDDMQELTLTNDWSKMLKWNPLSIFRGGYCNGNNLLNWVKKQTSGKRFRDLDVGLTIVASDVTTEKPYIFSNKATPDVIIGRAARASASIPFVYTPMKEGKALLMDGGMQDNIPAGHLVIDDVPRVGINLVSAATPFKTGSHSIFDVAPRLLDMILTANENAHVALANKSGAHFAFIETGYANGLDSDMPSSLRAELLQDGYVEAKNALALIRRQSKSSSISK